MNTSSTGFQEVQHTADLELKVWALSLPELFSQAARGMYHLAGGSPAGNPPASASRKITLEAHDAESLLIRFLNELLYLLEDDGLMFPDPELEIIQNTRLEANLRGYPAARYQRDIKAATFHRVKIQKEGGLLTVYIVFDI